MQSPTRRSKKRNNKQDQETPVSSKFLIIVIIPNIVNRLPSHIINTTTLIIIISPLPENPKRRQRFLHRRSFHQRPRPDLKTTTAATTTSSTKNGRLFDSKVDFPPDLNRRSSNVTRRSDVSAAARSRRLETDRDRRRAPSRRTFENEFAAAGSRGSFFDAAGYAAIAMRTLRCDGQGVETGTDR